MAIKADEELGAVEAVETPAHEQTHVDVFEKVANIHLNSEIADESVQPALEFILNSNMANEDIAIINLFIDSMGGDLSSAMKLIDVIRMSRIPVRTIAWGNLASAALMIFMAGHERVISVNCSVLSHYASMQIGNMNILVADPSRQQEFNLIIERLHALYMECTGRPLSYVKKHLLKSHDVVLSATQLIKHGGADRLMPRSMDWLTTGLDNHKKA
jgi:ATP-dependent protease ClpP protease subunit